MEQLYTALQSGIASLASYLADHVLLCQVNVAGRMPSRQELVVWPGKP